MSAVAGIILSLFFVARVVSDVTDTSWTRALLHAVVVDVAWMSHLWHIAYGEDRVPTCPHTTQAPFGWVHCAAWDWNTFVNTYELTLPVEFIVLSALLFWYNRIKPLGLVVYVLNSVHMTLAIALLLMPPDALNEFTDVFDWIGFACTLFIAMWL